MEFLSLVFLLMGLVTSLPVCAQNPVYRCETAGRVSYAHEPCVSARKIDATPTQGMDTMTGQSRKGSDVQRHERQAATGKALQPLTGMSPG